MTPPIRIMLKNRDFFSRRNIAIGILFSIGLALFLTIYDGVLKQNGLTSLDAPLRAWVDANQDTRMTAVMYLVTELSAPLSISIITILGSLIWAWRKKDYWRPALTIGAVGFALIATAIIKMITARERPMIADLVEANVMTTYSFPSGHTIGAAVLLFVVAYFICAKAPTLHRIITWGVIVMTDIALVAYSRIYLGYHWLTDVTASIGLAFIILAIVIAIDTYAKPRKRAISSEAV